MKEREKECDTEHYLKVLELFGEMKRKKKREKVDIKGRKIEKERKRDRERERG